LAVKLEHFNTCPKSELLKTYNEQRNNFYAQNVLRRLVYTYLYLNPVEFRLRQELEQNILRAGSNKKLIDNPSKKKRPPTLPR